MKTNKLWKCPGPLNVKIKNQYLVKIGNPKLVHFPAEEGAAEQTVNSENEFKSYHNKQAGTLCSRDFKVVQSLKTPQRLNAGGWT